MTDAIVTAAAPELIASLEALQTFITNLGPDPTKIPLTAGPALQVFLGTVGLQLPALANSEWGALQTTGISQVSSLITKLKTPS